MPITPDQRGRRRGRIGSSDSPAIVGVDPHRNAHDVYLTKVYDRTESSEEKVKAKEAVSIGNDFERPLLRWASDQLGIEIIENAEREHPTNSLFAANHDALALHQPVGLEAKTGGEGWGAEGTDEVPDRVLVQAQHQCYVSDLEVVWVPVLTARFDRLVRMMYRVPRNEKLIAAIVRRDQDFWDNNVLAGLPPKELVPSLETVKALRRAPEKVAVVDEELVAAFRRAQFARKVAEAEEEKVKATLLASIGDAEGLTDEFGSLLYRYLPESRTTVDSKALKLQMPNVYEQFTRVSTGPVLREVRKKADRPKEETK